MGKHCAKKSKILYTPIFRITRSLNRGHPLDVHFNHFRRSWAKIYTALGSCPPHLFAPIGTAACGSADGRWSRLYHPSAYLASPDPMSLELAEGTYLLGLRYRVLRRPRNVVLSPASTSIECERLVCSEVFLGRGGEIRSKRQRPTSQRRRRRLSGKCPGGATLSDNTAAVVTIT